MIKGFEEFQKVGKDGFDAYVRSFGEMNKGFQAIAAEFTDYSKKAFEDSTKAFEQLAGAKSIVQVRRTDDAVAKDDGPEAAVARIEQHLKQGSLTKALAEVKKLPESAQQAAKAWISELEARASVDGAIAEVEDQLKASLGGGAKGERKEG